MSQLIVYQQLINRIIRFQIFAVHLHLKTEQLYFLNSCILHCYNIKLTAIEL